MTDKQLFQKLAQEVREKAFAYWENELATVKVTLAKRRDQEKYDHALQLAKETIKQGAKIGKFRLPIIKLRSGSDFFPKPYAEDFLLEWLVGTTAYIANMLTDEGFLVTIERKQSSKLSNFYLVVDFTPDSTNS